MLMLSWLKKKRNMRVITIGRFDIVTAGFVNEKSGPIP